MKRGAAKTIAGVRVNPRLPRNFGCTPNDSRPESHQKWWGRPYIETFTDDDNPKWREYWPSGVRYDVRCLDGGAWDRPTCWGGFATLEEALECAGTGPVWRKRAGGGSQP